MDSSRRTRSQGKMKMVFPPRQRFGELVISRMAGQTRGREDFQAETQDSIGPFRRKWFLRAFHRRDARRS